MRNSQTAIYYVIFPRTPTRQKILTSGPKLFFFFRFHPFLIYHCNDDPFVALCTAMVMRPSSAVENDCDKGAAPALRDTYGAVEAQMQGLTDT